MNLFLSFARETTILAEAWHGGCPTKEYDIWCTHSCCLVDKRSPPWWARVVLLMVENELNHPYPRNNLNPPQSGRDVKSTILGWSYFPCLSHGSTGSIFQELHLSASHFQRCFVADLHGPFPTSETCPVPPENMVSQFHNMIHGMHVSVTVSRKSGIPPRKLGGNQQF